jgi:hypothetical protein
VGDSGDTPATVVLVVDERTERVVGRVDARRPDLALVDELARLALAARRRGWVIGLRGVPLELRALLELVGLAEVLALEPRRKAELGEQLGEDEVMQPRDPLA